MVGWVGGGGGAMMAKLKPGCSVGFCAVHSQLAQAHRWGLRIKTPGHVAQPMTSILLLQILRESTCVVPLASPALSPSASAGSAIAWVPTCRELPRNLRMHSIV